MSRERALRRADRERVQGLAHEDRERRDARVRQRRRRAERTRAKLPSLPQRTRWRGQQGILARRRRLQNAALLVLAVAGQVAVWSLTADWWLRVAAAIFTALTLPVLATLAFDRRN